MSGPHDLLFREAFAEPEPAAFLVRLVLGVDIPVQHLTRVDAASVTNGEERIPDLVWALSPTLAVRVVWQHQRTVDPAFDLRVLRDAGVLLTSWARQGELPALITSVVYQGGPPWPAPTDVRQRMARVPYTLDPLVLRCPYRVLDLAQVDDETLGAAPLLARITLVALRAWPVLGRDRIWHVVDAIGHGLRDLLRLRGPDATRRFWRYLIHVAGRPPGEAVMARLEEIDPDLAEDYVSYATQLRLEGRRLGRDEGRERGREEGREEGRDAALEVLLELGTARFGPPPPRALDALRAASLETLRAWARVLAQANGWAVLDDAPHA